MPSTVKGRTEDRSPHVISGFPDQIANVIDAPNQLATENDAQLAKPKVYEIQSTLVDLVTQLGVAIRGVQILDGVTKQGQMMGRCVFDMLLQIFDTILKKTQSLICPSHRVRAPTDLMFAPKASERTLIRGHLYGRDDFQVDFGDSGGHSYREPVLFTCPGGDVIMKWSACGWHSLFAMVQALCHGTPRQPRTGPNTA